MQIPAIISLLLLYGVQVYEEALRSKACSAIHLTHIDKDYECDTFFPSLDNSVFKLWSAAPPQRSSKDLFEFLCYTRFDLRTPQQQLPPGTASRHEELQVIEPRRNLRSA